MTERAPIFSVIYLICYSAALLHRLRVGEFGSGLTLDRILGGAALCGIGFTISLFIIDLAIPSESAQNDARVGVLAAFLVAFALATIIFRPATSSTTSSIKNRKTSSVSPKT